MNHFSTMSVKHLTIIIYFDLLILVFFFPHTELMKKTERDLKKTQRGVDRDRAKLEREEKKLVG